MRAKSPFLFAAAIALIIIPLSLCSAQQPLPDEYQVRAAIIVNLVRFITFKPTRDDPRGPVRVCLLGYDQQSSVLESYLSTHPIDGRPFQVRRIMSDDKTEGCQVLYVCPSERHAFDQLSAQLAGTGVLTISDHRMFAPDGGVIGLPVVGDRIEIQINLERAEQSGLVISSRLLSLAKVIRKGAWR